MYKAQKFLSLRAKNIFLTPLYLFATICSSSEQMNNKNNNILDHEQILALLKEIELNPQITQRYLSQKLSLSLGKINFLINALVEKGIIKTKNFKNSKNKLAYMYLLTPRGLKTKIQITHQFLTRKINEYEKLRHEIVRLRREVTV